MPVVVQHIRISWTKAQRTAATATKRNTIPRTLPLIPADGEYIRQRHTFDCFDGEHRHKLVDEVVLHRVPLETRGIRHVVRDDQLRMRATWTVEMGKPHRASSGVHALDFGQYVQIVANGRHTDSEGGHLYTREFFNVAWTRKVHDALFSSASPAFVVDLEVDLF